MNKLLPIFAVLVCLAPTAAPVAADAHAAGFQQDWNGKRHKGDNDNNGGHRSNWSGGDNRGNRRDDNRRDDRAIQARSMAKGYRNVTDVIRVDPEGGSNFTAKVMTRDGHLLYLRINTDTGSVSED